MREEQSRKELAVFLLVEPRAFDVEEVKTGNEARERERVDRQLRDRLVGARVGLVVKDMHGAVAHLQEINMAGDRPLGRSHPRRELDAMLLLQRADVGL